MPLLPGSTFLGQQVEGTMHFHLIGCIACTWQAHHMGVPEEDLT